MELIKFSVYPANGKIPIIVDMGFKNIVIIIASVIPFTVATSANYLLLTPSKPSNIIFSILSKFSNINSLSIPNSCNFVAVDFMCGLACLVC